MSEDDPKAVLADTADRAKGAMHDAAETMKSALGNGASAAQETLRAAGRQTGAAAQALYGQSGDILGVVERAVADNPWAAIAAAAAVGFGLASLLRRR